MVTTYDINAARTLVMQVDGAFLAGSCLIDIDKAKDVDVVVPQRSQLTLHKLRGAYGLKGYSPELNEDYGPDLHDDIIISLYRGNHNLNVIVVSDLFYPAYVAGAREYLRNPKRYALKQEREAVHKAMKKVVSDMLSGAWHDHRYLIADALDRHG